MLLYGILQVIFINYMLEFNKLINSYSLILQIQIMQSIQQVEFQDMMPIDLMTENLRKIQKELTQHSHNSDQFSENNSERQQYPPGSQSSPKTNTPSITNRQNDGFQEIKQTYIQYIQTKQFPSNHELKLQMLLQEQISIGSMVALFQMLYYFRQIINQQIIKEIGYKAFRQIKICEEPKLIEVLAEVISLCGICDQEIIRYFASALLEGSLSFEHCYKVLVNSGVMGLQTLLELANRDYKKLSLQILDHLSRNEQVLIDIVVPYLLADLVQGNQKKKMIALAALNRLNSLVGGDIRVIEVLEELLEVGQIDRGFIVSVLKSSGYEGEKTLIKLLRKNLGNEKICIPIISVLPWRPKSQPIIRMKTIQYCVGGGFLPGSLYQYQGSVSPSAYQYTQVDCCDSLCLNSRDFLASLLRMLHLRIQQGHSQLDIRKDPLGNKSMFTIIEIVNQMQNNQVLPLDGEIIKVLHQCLSHQNPSIRQAALNAIGIIGLPQGLDSLDKISKCLWDSQSKNRSMACWTLSKICPQNDYKSISRLVQLLKDNFWKVRTAACIALGNIVKKPLQNVIEGYIRALKDGSINKGTVCQAMISLGQTGQQILLQLLRTSPQSDFKMSEAILSSFKSVNVSSTNVDFIIEQLFKFCKNSRVETRAICLETLNSLRIRFTKVNQDVTYLQGKNILPLYYYFLEDPSPKLRQLASEAILSFGAQAQLIFIEGLTRGSVLIRIESAKALGKLGLQNFRALILGLRDEDQKVRKCTSSAILSNFTTQDIYLHYCQKQYQLPSLLCSMKDILGHPSLKLQIKKMMKELIYKFEKDKRSNSSNKENFSQDRNITQNSLRQFKLKRIG